MTTVHLLFWDVKRETGAVACASRARAISEALEWLDNHADDLDDDEYEDAADELRRLGKVWIERLEAGYWIEEQEVLE